MSWPFRNSRPGHKVRPYIRKNERAVGPGKSQKGEGNGVSLGGLGLTRCGRGNRSRSAGRWPRGRAVPNPPWRDNSGEPQAPKPGSFQTVPRRAQAQVRRTFFGPVPMKLLSWKFRSSGARTYRRRRSSAPILSGRCRRTILRIRPRSHEAHFAQVIANKPPRPQSRWNTSAAPRETGLLSGLLGMTSPMYFHHRWHTSVCATAAQLASSSIST